MPIQYTRLWYLIPIASALFAIVYFEVRAREQSSYVEELHRLAGNEFVLEPRTKSSGCILTGGMPDHACTPGALFPEATREEICVPGYARSKRDVSIGTKRSIIAAYGLSDDDSTEYHIDHLISLQLGGSNDIANLWPLYLEPRPGKREKDRVENYLHAHLCAGTLSLPEAQKLITQWRAVYTLVFDDANP